MRHRERVTQPITLAQFAFWNDTPREYKKKVWLLLAFTARYGNQAVSDLRRWPRQTLVSFSRALDRLLEDENRKPEDGDNDDEDW